MEIIFTLLNRKEIDKKKKKKNLDTIHTYIYYICTCLFVCVTKVKLYAYKIVS